MKLDYALWEVTKRCNLQCLHCRADASPDKKEDNLIKGEDTQRLLRELKELDCPILTLTGGEPLMRPDIVEIIAYASKIGLKIRIQSNSLLLTEKLANQLKDAGLVYYGVGLDGSKPEINDKIRNLPGAFNKAIENIKMLVAKGFRVHVEYTITKWNIDDIVPTLNLLEALGIATFQARAAVFEGRAGQNKEEFILNLQDYQKALRIIAQERKKRKGKIIVGCQDPLYHLVDEDLLAEIKNYGTDNKVRSGCTAGLNMIHIRVDGEIGVCTFLPITLGNFYQQSLKEIWENKNSIKEIKQLCNRELTGKCRSCEDKFICAGCRARALEINHNLLGSDPYCFKK